jgi:hypothetical protein
MKVILSGTNKRSCTPPAINRQNITLRHQTSATTIIATRYGEMGGVSGSGSICDAT